MKLNYLNLRYFRNHKKLEINFDDSLTIINGPNGSGKSNILEAIQVISTGKSQRARYDRDLINYEHEHCSIKANYLTEEQEYDLEVQIIKNQDFEHTSTKVVKINKVTKSVSYMAGLLNTVSFAPHDIEIIIGSPSDRRRFMDFILIQTDRGYKKALSTYQKALRQRNKLLEMINEYGRGYDQLDYWTQKILAEGTFIQNKRQELLESVNAAAAINIKNLDNTNSTIVISYKHNLINKERLEKHKDHEISAKTTLVGPHKDDFRIEYNGHDLAEFGSRGQQRTVLLAIKISEVDYFNTHTGESPILLLDDIFSELDENHKKAVMEIIGKQQTIITYADNPGVLDKIDYRLIKL